MIPARIRSAHHHSAIHSGNMLLDPVNILVPLHDPQLVLLAVLHCEHNAEGEAILRRISIFAYFHYFKISAVSCCNTSSFCKLQFIKFTFFSFGSWRRILQSEKPVPDKFNCCKFFNLDNTASWEKGVPLKSNRCKLSRFARKLKSWMSRYLIVSVFNFFILPTADQSPGLQ